jgi:BirA family transcriptional regulator, biotin operon repressor / biotin---[acetyl-CoA-carboxylase] ligase
VRGRELPRHLAGAEAQATKVTGAGRAADPGLLRSAEAVWQALSPLLPGLTVEVLPEIDSTNSELMRRARAGHLEPVLLVAQRQSAGRGRLGRSWYGDEHASLTFSLGLPMAPADWSGLSLAVGVSLAESLHPDVRLKWPNDLWIDGRKLGGILIETATGHAGHHATRHAVVGVGINLAALSGDGLSQPPASLRELIPDAEGGGTLVRLAPGLVRALQVFEHSGFAAFQARFAALDGLRGRKVVLSDGTAGVAEGTDAQGALLVHTAGAVKTVISSEVSVRPVADAG